MNDTNYAEALRALQETQVPFIVGGGYAFRFYSGIERPTDDLDLFCKTSDYPRLLHALVAIGHESTVQDARWIAKSVKDDVKIDFIFNSTNGLTAVDDFWFERGVDSKLFESPIKYMGIEELIWCKLFICDRYRYDGADINHLLVEKGDSIDWKWLLHRMDPNWQLLLSQLIQFCYVYPAERKKVPRWLMDELLQRNQDLMTLPTSKDKVCRGPLISQTQYEIDITTRGYRILTYATV